MFTRIYYKALALYNLDGNAPTLDIKNYMGENRTTNTVGNHANYVRSALKNFCTTAKTASGVGTSVAFGDGNEAPTLDDYQLSGNHFTTYTGMYSLAYDSAKNAVVATYTLQNNGTQDFTIREVGLYSTPNQSYYTVLLLREVLDTPVTIPAGGIGMVTLSIKVNTPEE